MIIKKSVDSHIKDPHILAIELIVGKNIWLTKIRWLYLLLIILFFAFYKYIADKVYLNFLNLALIIGLAVFINLMFILSLRRRLKQPLKKLEYKPLFSLASLQLGALRRVTETSWGLHHHERCQPLREQEDGEGPGQEQSLRVIANQIS